MIHLLNGIGLGEVNNVIHSLICHYSHHTKTGKSFFQYKAVKHNNCAV